MNPVERKNSLADRVELALKTKDNHQRRMKCSTCGKGYLGRSGSTSCGDACRKAKSRG